MKKIFAATILTSVLAFTGVFYSCSSETDYCKAYCQKAGECIECGGEIDMDGCIDECKSLDTDTQKKLVNCYKGDCENIFICDEIIGTKKPSPCQ